MSAFETPLRPPKTPDYRPNLDEAMELTYTDPNLESYPEDSPPASQLEPRHKAELAKQRSNKVYAFKKKAVKKKTFRGIADPRGSQGRGNMKTPSALSSSRSKKLKPPF
ncbi:unnamed protein product [Pocillopora meandrina]|uniref:Uncharacterized protein n=1 Tax=Pocillopora meandrina TaxID=46732 RepID=A0AAU9Y2F5_9CNID|nr:unnamed protein product [Pocillopora meandrina]CAH3163207.1 unnamed protein product [Pocillopora meandrina]